jgi:hypothetical protein
MGFGAFHDRNNVVQESKWLGIGKNCVLQIEILRYFLAGCSRHAQKTATKTGESDNSNVT